MWEQARLRANDVLHPQEEGGYGPLQRIGGGLIVGTKIIPEKKEKRLVILRADKMPGEPEIKTMSKAFGVPATAKRLPTSITLKEEILFGCAFVWS